MENLPAFLFLIPFLTALLMPMIGMFRRNWCGPISIAALSATSAVALLAIIQTQTQGPIRYTLGGWLPPLGIEWLLDGLSGLMTALVSLVALIAVFNAGPSIRATLAPKIVPFYTLVLLLISALNGIVLTADFFNLFVFLELASLSAYALIAVSGSQALVSAFRYVILGTIGASFYLLGVGYLYASTGTLNMADMAAQLPQLLESRAVMSGLVFIVIGLCIKMALFPLHGWLPDAYAHASEAICPLLAGLMTKVSLYAFTRIMFWVLGGSTFWEDIPLMTFLGWVGALATVAGTLLALSETNLKRIFAYGGISHIGLVVLGISLGNQTGFAGGIFYLVNDAIMQASLFAVAGSIIYCKRITDVSDLVPLARQMPWTAAALIVTALSMIGIPPTGGFFGKWFILLGAMEAKNYLAVAVILLGTLLTLAYFAKIAERMFMEKKQITRTVGPEEPLPMRLSMGALTAAILLLGVFSDSAISWIQEFALPPGL